MFLFTSHLVPSPGDRVLGLLVPSGGRARRGTVGAFRPGFQVVRAVALEGRILSGGWKEVEGGPGHGRWHQEEPHTVGRKVNLEKCWICRSEGWFIEETCISMASSIYIVQDSSGKRWTERITHSARRALTLGPARK